MPPSVVLSELTLPGYDRFSILPPGRTLEPLQRNVTPQPMNPCSIRSMKRTNLAPRLALIIPLAAAGTALAGTGKEPKAPVAPPQMMVMPELSPWRISAGYAHRQFDHIGMATGSESALFSLPRLARASAHGDSGAGPATGYADRKYRDGFVFIDSATVSGGGDTWNWGYDSSSQVGTGSLTYHGGDGATSSWSDSSSATNPGSWNGDDSAGGPVLQIDRFIARAGQFDIGASLQWGFWNLDGSHSGTSFAAQQSSAVHQRHATDVYDTAGIIVPLAPYQGSYNGPGPLLRNEPSQRHHSTGRTLDQDSVTFANRIGESFDVDLHALSLGPTVSFPFGRFAITVSGGLALNIASYDASHTETLTATDASGSSRTLQTWRDSASGTDVLLGAYTQGALSCAITDRLSVSAYGRADWSKTLEKEVGPSTLTFDPGGWSAGAMVSWRF